MQAVVWHALLCSTGMHARRALQGRHCERAHPLPRQLQKQTCCTQYRRGGPAQPHLEVCALHWFPCRKQEEAR
jgi:hypothetical protein